MSAEPVKDRIEEMSGKLDAIAEEAARLRRLRSGAEELAAAALGGEPRRSPAAAQLVQDLLANAELLSAALRQLASAADFLEDAQPIVREVYQQALDGFQRLEDKGYFRAAAGSLRVADALVEAHSAADLRQIEASAPQMIGLLREATRPEALQALEAIVHGFGRVQATMNVDKSIVGIVRDLNTREARRGLSILVEFLKVVGSVNVGVAPAAGVPAQISER
jgi:uncharacterized protein YjgD (DUF1641 family)